MIDCRTIGRTWINRTSTRAPVVPGSARAPGGAEADVAGRREYVNGRILDAPNPGATASEFRERPCGGPRHRPRRRADGRSVGDCACEMSRFQEVFLTPPV